LFWYPRGDNIGHVSLFIVDTCLYISFWPQDKSKQFSSVRSTANTYVDDKREEGRDADDVHKTRIGLDLNAVEKFWESAKRKDYSFVTNNCADVVEHTLESGNHDFKCEQFVSIPPAEMPSTITIYVAQGPYKTQMDIIRQKLEMFRDRALGKAILN